jgi:hypothetical protein
MEGKFSDIFAELVGSRRLGWTEHCSVLHSPWNCVVQTHMGNPADFRPAQLSEHAHIVCAGPDARQVGK